MRVIIASLLFPIIAHAQLDHRAGDILAYTDSVVSSMPSGISTGQYQIPSAAYLNAWKIVLTNALQRNDSLAASQAQSLSYRLVSFIDTTTGVWPSMQEYRVLEKLPNSSNYWGTYVFAVSPGRPQLILQSPHPINDSRTGLQSAYVFRYTAARAFFLAGTHRCNSSTYSSCAGTTSTCGTSEPYRESDVAHSVSTPFYIATVAAEEQEQPYVVQLHGFAKLSTDPHLIMSNSTSLAPNLDLLAQVRDALLVADNSLTFKIGHLDAGWTRLLGTTNVEGRMINGSSDPCGQSSPSNVGRFFHIEQAYTGLRNDANGWQKMASALATVFSPTTGAPTDGHLPKGFDLRHNYPNPFNPSTTIEFTLPEEADVVLDIVSITGQVVETLLTGTWSAGAHRAVWNADAAGGVYFARLRLVDNRNVQLVQKIILNK